MGVTIATVAIGMLFGQNVTAAFTAHQKMEVPVGFGIGYEPFNFRLPDEALDGIHYTGIRPGGMPEATIAKGSIVSLPISIEPTGIAKKPITIQFTTTFGDQLGLPKLPPGVHVTIQPNTLVLQPGQGTTTINMVVQVDGNAPDGTYMQNIVGKWGGPNDFLGSAVSLKIGHGTQQFLLPKDVGQ